MLTYFLYLTHLSPFLYDCRALMVFSMKFWDRLSQQFNSLFCFNFPSQKQKNEWVSWKWLGRRFAIKERYGPPEEWGSNLYQKMLNKACLAVLRHQLRFAWTLNVSHQCGWRAFPCVQLLRCRHLVWLGSRWVYKTEGERYKDIAGICKGNIMIMDFGI